MFLFRIVSRVLLALAFLAVALVSSAAEARPNIIFLLGDDLRWDAMRHAGNPIIETPALDRLAADGVSFTNSYVTTSICMVSRATFFTGQYESAHKIHDFATPFAPRPRGRIRCCCARRIPHGLHRQVGHRR